MLRAMSALSSSEVHLTSCMTKVYASIGSNIEPTVNIQMCITALRARYGTVDLSPVYETLAVGFVGAAFYNLVVGFTTDEEAHAVAQFFRTLERESGRDLHHAKFAPRTLDVDLLLYGDQVLDEAHLKIPRGEILEYAFVLRPLAELCPMGRHPVLGETFQDLWQTFQGEKQGLKPVLGLEL